MFFPSLVTLSPNSSHDPALSGKLFLAAVLNVIVLDCWPFSKNLQKNQWKFNCLNVQIHMGTFE